LLVLYSFIQHAAYTYVRNTFLKSLPHPQTIRKWFSKIDISPSISQPVLDSIKKMIKNNLMNGKELQFGIQVDEISIKRSIEWDGKMFHGTVDLGLNNDNDDNSEEATYALVYLC